MKTPIINAIISGPTSSPQKQYQQIVLLSNRDLIDQMIYPDTKYIIKHNFDLNGQTVNIPENCIIAIDGGSISNGILVGDNTILLNVNRADNILNNVTLSGTWGPQDYLYEKEEVINDSTLYNNMSLLYYDKEKRKILWWTGDKFAELKF